MPPRRKTTNPTSRLYPEFAAGGFARNDQRVLFYARVNALLDRSMAVLDFGAGRGKWAEKEGGFRRELANLRGRCRAVVGADIDPAVVRNPDLDDARVFKPGEPLPFGDGEFDLIVSWTVFEHIGDADLYVRELDRVLKPGGWICAFTPHKWSYPAIGARLLPNSLHAGFLRFSSPRRKEADIFPTFYRLNTIRALKRHFPEPRFAHYTYASSGPPSYHGGMVALARFWQACELILPKRSLHVFIRKVG